MLSLRGGYPVQLTASEKPASDPQWSPDGRRLAYVRDDEIWVVEADGSRSTQVVGKPGRWSAPRWSPDGQRLAFLSRRRGWTQVWLIDAPVPRRGRPATEPKPPRPPSSPRPASTSTRSSGRRTGARLAVMAPRGPTTEETAQIAFVDVATGDTRVVAGERSVDVGAPLAPDGSLLYVSDADGWFQVVRLTADGHDRIVLTSGEREHGDPPADVGSAPLPSPDGARFVHVEVHDGARRTWSSATRGGRAAKRGRGRPPKTPRTVSAAARRQPDQPVGRRLASRSAGSPTGRGSRRSASARRGRGPVAAAGARASPPDDARPRQVTDSLPAVLARGAVARRVAGRRAVVVHGPRRAPDRGHALAARTTRPASAAATRVPTIVYPARRPDGPGLPLVPAVQAAARRTRASRSSTSTSAGRPATAAAFRLANHDEWGHADVHDLVDAARWAAEQPWSDGRLAIYGGSYGGYLVLCALVEEPAMWRAGVDLYGDSEIAESYRHGDRLGRLDLHKMMGSPDDPRPDRGLPARLAGLSRGADRGAAAASSTAARTSASSR